MRTISFPVCPSWRLEARLVRNMDTTTPITTTTTHTFTPLSLSAAVSRNLAFLSQNGSREVERLKNQS